jgi:hypothetical protein
MSDIVRYINREGIEASLDLDDIRAFTKEGKKIHLIKEYRFVTGKGLKDSKDAVESVSTIEGMVELFRNSLHTICEPYSKQEFLHLIENAVDNMHHLAYDDMLVATIALLTNVKNNGGLEKLAKDRDRFINNI